MLTVVGLGFLLVVTAPETGEEARLQMLAEGRGWERRDDLSCRGQAWPQFGRVVSQYAYALTATAAETRLTLDSSGMTELGFQEFTGWKRLGRFEVRTYRSAAPRNVYYTFSIDTASRAGTTVCAVVWRR